MGFSVWGFETADPETVAPRQKRARPSGTYPPRTSLLLSSSLLSRLELSGTQVYEPSIRALLGTSSHFCEVVAPFPVAEDLRERQITRMVWCRV